MAKLATLAYELLYDLKRVMARELFV
ncbi:hypothetical protein VCRA2114E365_70134 [Vibrio crassostreae]|uniref:Uncharacterized protein n=1 Tax=Vibrio crassostreae TaxID=246167 RepID=A0ABP1WZ13_9VIBR|nr:hypothetical protein VCRA2117O428_100137 [Vibrio crassostreae]CAK1706473.1 hypothetical protein VCRA2113O416_100138 [Vibrio crassostreae]CAK1833374.1 hypothetical protein VCRA2110O182_10225 [Vibrio crassostreae]CAK1847342.1 hypothetical protein VCRA2113O322_10211 [Vibrio crassostreae]CAK1862143.1 hypothetical protein VCRA2113O324_10208 [Vibrio crassostreae]